MLSDVPTIRHQRICCWHATNLVCMLADEFADQWLIHKNPYDYADADFPERTGSRI